MPSFNPITFFRELRRRRVFRVAVIYGVGAWGVIAACDVIFPQLTQWVADPDDAMRAVFIAALVNFPVALVFGWMYDITADGVQRTASFSETAHDPDTSLHRVDYGIITGLSLVALAVIAATTLHIVRIPAPEPVASITAAELEIPENSIAVLPFVNMSDDPANEFFADGISEELLNLLARLPELRVTARTSSFSFKGKDATIADIATQLGVAHILEGAVRRDGERVRVTAQLIETGSETNLWSGTYDRTLDDIFAIQDEIAREVVGSLKITLLGEAMPRSRTTDPQAYLLYLQCNNFRAGSEEVLRRGEEYCRQSLEIDPDYARAWSALGSIYGNLAISGHVDFKEGYQRLKEFKQRALELDPDLAEAHASLGFRAMMYDRDLAAAADHYRAALDLAPGDYRVLGGAAVFAETLGRFERAIELAERALEVNPLGHVVYSNTAIVHCYIGEFERANERFEKAAELDHDAEGDPWRARCWLQQGQPDKALAEAASIASESRRLWVQSMAYHDLGKHGEAEESLNALIEGHAHEAAAFIAENYARRGDIDQAFEWLQRAINEKQYMWGSLVFDPAFSTLHADQRWQAIRAKDGRSEEQLQKIDF